MFEGKRPPEPVVLLVDNKVRDLDVAALIAFQLERRGVKCYLEPLEAFRAALGAHRPGMIIFNHLTAGHLATWSRRLAAMNVLTAVLPNEGIAYDPDDMRYIAGKHHKDAHIDFMLSWNEPHANAVRNEYGGSKTKIEVIGVPRFDFYFEPWSKVFRNPAPVTSGRPKILVCTNFITARYHELPKEDGDRFFAPWIGRIAVMGDHRKSIERHWLGRNRFLDFLKALIDADKYEVTLRPHPSEDKEFYRRWIEALPASSRAHLGFDPGSNITGLILDCDLEISCETCSTAIESWIAKKPTIELTFERDPLWYKEEHARGNVACSDPAQLVALVDQAIAEPTQREKQPARQEILRKWCASPDGTSTDRIAAIVANAIHEKKPADWSQLSFNDHRRALKLRGRNLFGLAYHHDTLMPIKRALFRKRYAVKDFAYKKSIEPRDVSEARRRLRQAFAATL
jgi:surface carbohydrate biosynthesis protein